MALVEIQVPDIGDFDEVAVIEVLVKAGDQIKAEQSLITVESDKASMEIPSSHAGVLKELRVNMGDKVKQGSIIAVVESAEAAAPAPAAAAPAPAAAAPAPVAAPVPAAAPAAAPAASGAATQIDIKIPDIGDFKDVAVIEMLVKVGDTVTAEQSLFTVESDKASMEIPSPAAGTITALALKIGDTVNVGDVVGQMSVQGAAAPAAQAAAPAPAAAAPAPAAAAPAAAAPVAAAAASAPAAAPAHNPTVAPTGKLPHASPSVRKFARELGVPLDEVKGSGNKGRITADDIQAFTKSVMAGAVQTKAQAATAPKGGSGGAGLDLLPWPKVDFAKFGPVERKDLSRIKKISGANLSRNWVMIPHVTNNDEADITDLEAFRVSTNKENEKSGVKVTMLAFVIKAVVAALKKFPEFNASLDGDTLVYKQYFHVGFAADTPNGLVVPVLRDADKKGILQISQEMGELAKKARDGKLGAADMQGGCFSISSLGGIGGTNFTPIINAPEVAILGLSKGQMKPVWDGKQFVPRLTLPLSLSYDHRVIDGASAARFNAFLGQVLADYRRILL
ncbi:MULTISPECIES: dihydrolipoyllysine-residue acetyltransferase [unclassified Delftia]|uniref:dihydrolipoyllysine-residue acetyltransferase n=1 Tax=unclassified Delftia TaxID=2613839 RepID=UPI0019021DBD|nr:MULTISPECIES: dihydrolipoyllysine-residue acetyltransferase [unclassified Delftia]MBK0113360.1 dihydrolipoyllysine-residue acetyltransferase [Delftia sp. S65]MBK0119051.1 dihydrolipoyllysine-residue acetyltransferase [Delftia sp. S67]MBK0130774.1 dihydrolipoyllysine-residue acetyltransferase [Delftia sp. S66]